MAKSGLGILMLGAVTSSPWDFRQVNQKLRASVCYSEMNIQPKDLSSPFQPISNKVLQTQGVVGVLGDRRVQLGRCWVLPVGAKCLGVTLYRPGGNRPRK